MEEKLRKTLPYTAKIPVTGSYDAVIAGGGPAGCAAALAAARRGLSVLLLESEGCLGGMAASGLVSHWLGGRTEDGQRWVAGGICRELAEEGTARGFAEIPLPKPGKGYDPRGWNPDTGGVLTAGIPVDPNGMALLYEEKMRDAVVSFLLKTTVLDVFQRDSEITHAVFHNKSGLQAAEGKVFIDATGDADLAQLSGCETVLGREEDRLSAPVTLQVHMERIDGKALKKYIDKNDAPRFLDEIEVWQKEGIWPFSWNRFITVQLLDDDTYLVNSPRITGIDGTDGQSVTQGFMAGRKEIYQLLEIMRKHIPGCSDARIKSVASRLGVRESRRIRGDFILTVDDLITGAEFPDTIGFSAYCWDLPDPKNPSLQPMDGRSRKKKITPIPYRVMIPKPADNLICPGRAVSVERDVLGPVRVMAPAMAMGEAAGAAAYHAVRNNLAFSALDIQKLRSDISNAGGVVDFRE